MLKNLFIFSVSLISILLIGVILYVVFSGSMKIFPAADMVVPVNKIAIESDPVLKKEIEFLEEAEKVASIESSVLINKKEIMAWIYPGAPTCGTKLEYSDGRKIDVLKPEYFKISDEGKLMLLTEKDHGCNGYSTSNIADLKKYSKAQYATFSSSYAGNMELFLNKAVEDNVDVDALVSFVVSNDITGIEIDFEDFGGWDSILYLKYKKFITNLGNALHENYKKLIIDGPATSNEVEQSWYVWRYADFVLLPVDQILVMTYDHQFDQGAGGPISPILWMRNTIRWTLNKFPDKNKIVFGIPSYGYKGVMGEQKFSLLTYEQIKKEIGFETAKRDSESYEMTWQNGDNIYFFQDDESMLKKLQVMDEEGVVSVSVWHLGGNLWFSKK